MSTKVVIDPITRIEGHLRIEVEVTNGVVTDAKSAGTLFRGFEVLLVGKDPRDASYVTDRVCGVCAGSHNWASSLTLDDAFGAKTPDGGRLIRNLILGAMWLHDHPLQFYHLSALDYLDITAVLKYQGKDPNLLAVKDKVAALAGAGDLYPLAPYYKRDEYCVTDPDLVTTAVYHYLVALEMQAKAKKMAAVFGGKIPLQSSNVVGGVTIQPDLQKIGDYATLLKEIKPFIENVYLQDVLTFGTGPLFPLAQAGVGAGPGNYLAYGGFGMDAHGKTFFPRGVVTNTDLAHVASPDTAKIAEDVRYSWYQQADTGLNPARGKTDYDLDKPGAYSWIKAPRYQGLPMEVGPLARMLVMQPAGLMDIITRYKIKPGAVARHAARAFETVLLANQIEVWLAQLQEMVANGTVQIQDTAHWEPPDQATGNGLTEAPRGALGHWINIQGKKIAMYQLVVPSTWNLSPRDDKGRPGPVESALVGTPVPDTDNPLNVVRVVRSFDPCIACAVHLIEPDSNRIKEFKVGGSPW